MQTVIATREDLTLEEDSIRAVHVALFHNRDLAEKSYGHSVGELRTMYARQIARADTNGGTDSSYRETVVTLHSGERLSLALIDIS